MRFILAYKYGLLQTRTERIDVIFSEPTTTCLIQYFQRRFKQQSTQFILKLKRNKHLLRVYRDWPLQHYGFNEGSQLCIQFIEQNFGSKQNGTINTRYLANVLRLRDHQLEGSVPTIKQSYNQQQNQDASRFSGLSYHNSTSSNFNIRKYLDDQCEKMLKQIQKKNIQGFLQVFQSVPQSVDQATLIQIQSKKPYIIDQLGMRGWGALHYAIFYDSFEIFKELLEMDVDVNKCTTDGWLPIQLAIDLNKLSMIDILLQSPSIDLNLTTIKGSPLHTAVKCGNKQILSKLLTKDFDTNLKDSNDKTAAQTTLNGEIVAMIKQYQQKKQVLNDYAKGNIPLSLTTIVKGEILKVVKPFMNLKQRYLLIDPFQGSMIRYQSVQDYPRKPKQLVPLNLIKGVRLVLQDQKSWHMKRQYCYFQFDEPKKQVYACKYKTTALKWINNIKLATKFAQQLEKNPRMISQIKRNQLIIKDTEEVQFQSPKKIKKNIFNVSVGSRKSQGVPSLENIKSADMSSSRGDIQESTPSKQIIQNNASNNKTSLQNSESPQKNSAQTKQQKSTFYQTKEELTANLNTITTNKVTFSSFNVLKVLGEGAFGKVLLVQYNPTGKQYALKALKKKNLILQRQLKYAMIQANILKQANHPFIVNLHFAFQTPQYLYLALDYCPGKDLSFHLAKDISFSEEQARFYTAQLVLAIQHLHSKNIIYRDLKPQNILLDAKGHIRLADFGLSKQTADEKTKSFCGSPAYLSPQMLTQKHAVKETDLYGIGAVLYQFLTGQPPYFSQDLNTLYRNIKQGRLKFPKCVSQVAKSLINSLLERDPKRRIGSQNMQDLKDHPFFASINWKRLQNMQIQPPQRSLSSEDQFSEEEETILNQIPAKRKNFTDFDYNDTNKKINRVLNFSFIKAEEVV